MLTTTVKPVICNLQLNLKLDLLKTTVRTDCLGFSLSCGRGMVIIMFMKMCIMCFIFPEISSYDLSICTGIYSITCI